MNGVSNIKLAVDFERVSAVNQAEVPSSGGSLGAWVTRANLAMLLVPLQSPGCRPGRNRLPAEW